MRKLSGSQEWDTFILSGPGERLFELQANLVALRLALNGEGNMEEGDRKLLSQIVVRSELLLVEYSDDVQALFKSLNEPPDPPPVGTS